MRCTEYQKEVIHILELIKEIDKLIIFFLVYTLIFITFFSTLSYTLPFVLALIFSLMLRRPSLFLIKRYKFKNSLAALTTTVLFFTIIISILYIFIYLLSTEAIQFAKVINEYITKITPDINNFIDSAQKYYYNLDPYILNAIKQNFNNFIPKISTISVSISKQLMSFLLIILSSIPYIMMVVIFTLFSTYYFICDFSKAKDKFKKYFPTDSSSKLIYIINETRSMLFKYMLSYSLVLSITSVLTLMGFLIFRVKYAILLSLLSAVFDVLPILGIGSIYIPIVAIFYSTGKIIPAAGILVWYFFVSLFRQFVEPKIVSSSLGLHPVAVLAALFIGLKASGLSGMIFCIFLVIFYTILKKVNVL
jgi:sporulation integral membrane protein YtvI